MNINAAAERHTIPTPETSVACDVSPAVGTLVGNQVLISDDYETATTSDPTTPTPHTISVTDQELFGATFIEQAVLRLTGGEPKIVGWVPDADLT